MSKLQNFKSSSHCRYLILYHIIFVCKYRHKVFQNHEFAELLKIKLHEIAKNYDFDIVSLELDYSKPDHIHFLIQGTPTLSPAQIVRVLKQESTYWAWQNFENYLKQFYWKKHKLFTSGYYCATCGNVSADKIKEYLEEQGSKC